VPCTSRANVRTARLRTRTRSIEPEDEGVSSGVVRQNLGFVVSRSVIARVFVPDIETRPTTTLEGRETNIGAAAAAEWLAISLCFDVAFMVTFGAASKNVRAYSTGLTSHMGG